MDVSLLTTNNKLELLKILTQSIKGKPYCIKPDELKGFITEFFQHYPISELMGRPVEDVFGLVYDAFLVIQKLGKHPSVKVYKPSFSENYWESKHSVVIGHCRNMPFLMDSVRMALTLNGIKVRSVNYVPLFCQRDKKGNLVKLDAESSHSADGNEALLHFEINTISNAKDLRQIEKGIHDVLRDVAIVNNDYKLMVNTVESIQKNADNGIKHYSKDEIDEVKQFLSWVMENNFTFLGYTFCEAARKATSKVQHHDKDTSSLCSHNLGQLTKSSAIEFIATHSRDHGLLSFSKLPIRSTVHRPAYPDHIIIKSYNEKGKLTGQHHLVGLYTSSVYRASVVNIPYLRQKIDAIYKDINTNINSYNGKVVRQVLETYPRDELFQSHTEQLSKTISEISYIHERQIVRLFMRKDATDNFVYTMVYIPRDLFSTDLREQIVSLLGSAVGAESHEFYTYYSESILSRTYIIFRLKQGVKTKWNINDLEKQVKLITKTWVSGFREALSDYYADEQGEQYYQNYKHAFSSAYQENFDAAQAIKDLKVVETLSDEKTLALELCEPTDEQSIHFKAFHKNKPLALSDVIPVLERMGLKVIGEHPYKIKTQSGMVWLHDFEMKSRLIAKADFHKIKKRFEDAFAQVWNQTAENDTFNSLVLSANIHWREVIVLRAYAAYMKQTLFPFSKLAIAKTLRNYPDLTQKIIDLFHHLFDPKCKLRQYRKINKSLLSELDRVESLNDDRILRRFIDLINGTLRTNFYQKDEKGRSKAYLSFKFNPREIISIPEPRPQYEIFVYSPTMEGVHLRGGKVARGGLRWSDRFEDFRTEVLGLVKAQQVKNAVIVPNGAKGGFIAKKTFPGMGRDDYLEEGIRCYKNFIRGLLDITDNLINGKIIAPKLVVRRDDDDPYLVVAADKGTATFSDIANSISQEYQHWLGDAFASGGSQGYDHKGMGITARGAWVSVQRHFKEKGVNVQKQDFTVVGIGDMAGDVFGNGMLMSEHICLTAAFNHLHIFIDPNPNSKTSFAERKRLFYLARSTWDDYNKKLLSKGGGIFSRTSKSITISPKMKKRFDINADKLTPNELISALLLSPVDLIWNGGIGTYIKSARETHTDIGDKANDTVRVNGSELRCKVFGEGGNLGMSQLGRIEYSMHGGRCNTDFIDNAGGVDCSDHEVNIKILLNEEVNKGRLTEKQRNQLLVKMTDTVAEMVLDNNYYQTQSISLAERESLNRINEYRRLIYSLESSGRLNRDLEFIPSDEEILERVASGEGLTRPELAVLNCYVKVQLKEELAVDSIASNPYIASWVEKAFPKQLFKKYKNQIHQHILRKEIIATQLANDMVDNMGITFCHRLVESTGESADKVAMAYVAARDIFQFDDFQEKVESLDYKVPAADQLSLLASMMRRVRRGTRWFLRNRRNALDSGKVVSTFESKVIEVIKATPKVLGNEERKLWDERCNYFKDLGLDQEWSNAMSMPGHLFSGLGIVETALESKSTISKAVGMHHLLGDKLGLYWFAHAVTDVPVENYWQAMARESFIDDIDKVLRVMSVNLLRLAGNSYQLEEALQLWMQENPQLISRWRKIAHDLQTNTVSDFAMFSVAMRELMDLMEVSRSCNALKFG